MPKHVGWIRVRRNSCRFIYLHLRRNLCLTSSATICQKTYNRTRDGGLLLDIMIYAQNSFGGSISKHPSRTHDTLCTKRRTVRGGVRPTLFSKSSCIDGEHCRRNEIIQPADLGLAEGGRTRLRAYTGLSQRSVAYSSDRYFVDLLGSSRGSHDFAMKLRLTASGPP